MLRFLKDSQIVVMDLVDLEHCGFDVSEFHSELFLAGIDDASAKFPIALVVNVAGGHILTPDTRQEAIAALTEARGKFQSLLDQISADEDKHE